MSSREASPESRPLLAGHRSGTPRPSSTPRSPFRHAILTVIAPSLLLHTFFNMATVIIDVAMSELGEAILCRARYGHVSDTARDPRCKSAAVQSDLSMLQAVELTVGLLPGVLTAIMYASIADRLGRKPVLAVSVFGMLCVFTCDLLIYRFPEMLSIYLIWPAALCNFIGGGPQVLLAITYTMFNDITPTAYRSTLFFYLSAAKIAGDLIGAPFAYATMERGVWVAALCGYTLYVGSFVLALLCRETLAKDLSDSSHRAEQQSGSTGTGNRESLGQTARRLLRHTGSSLRCIFWDNKKLGMLLISLLFTEFGSYSSILLMQYMRKRFSWSWSKASLFLSIKTFTRLALVTLIMPLISHALSATKMTPLVRDARIASCSLLGTMTGAFGISAAANHVVLIPFMALFALIDVYSATMHSLLALMAPQDAVATLFSVMAVLRYLGIMVAGPSMAAAFRMGLNWGSDWVGLPFAVAGLLMSVALAIVVGVTVCRPIDGSRIRADNSSDP